MHGESDEHLHTRPAVLIRQAAKCPPGSTNGTVKCKDECLPPSLPSQMQTESPTLRNLSPRQTLQRGKHTEDALKCAQCDPCVIGPGKAGDPRRAQAACPAKAPLLRIFRSFWRPPKDLPATSLRSLRAIVTRSLQRSARRVALALLYFTPFLYLKLPWLLFLREKCCQTGWKASLGPAIGKSSYFELLTVTEAATSAHTSNLEGTKTNKYESSAKPSKSGVCVGRGLEIQFPGTQRGHAHRLHLSLRGRLCPARSTEMTTCPSQTLGRGCSRNLPSSTKREANSSSLALCFLRSSGVSVPGVSQGSARVGARGTKAPRQHRRARPQKPGPTPAAHSDFPGAFVAKHLPISENVFI